MKKALLFILLFSSATNYSYSLEKSIYALGLAGGIGSIAFWLPSTIDTIKNKGVCGAISTTHIPRILLDVLLITLCWDKIK